MIDGHLSVQDPSSKKERKAGISDRQAGRHTYWPKEVVGFKMLLFIGILSIYTYSYLKSVPNLDLVLLVVT